MKLNKKEGIELLDRFGLPTVKILNPMSLTADSPELKDGISVRLSPKGGQEEMYFCHQFTMLKI